MHACDGPHLMSGVQLGKNLLLCIGVTGEVTGDVVRFIDTSTFSTIDGVAQVRTCGPLVQGKEGLTTGFAMKGIYGGATVAGSHPPIMICSQVPSLGPVHIDSNTQATERDGMHACPFGQIMVGIKIIPNTPSDLACALPP
jgi:hypothetical protein